MKLKLFIIYGVISFFAVSCAPEIKHPDLQIVKSDAWFDSTQSLVNIDSAWWESFNDDRLDSVIARVFANNYNLKSAAAALEAAEAQVTIAGSALFPSLSLAANASRREQSLVTFPAQIRNVITNPANTFGVSANVSWELDLWGKVRSARSAAAANFEASEADYKGFRLSLTAQAIKGWFAAIEAHKQYELSKSNLESYTYSQERIFARYQKGIRSSLDYRLTNSGKATAEYQMIQRQQMRDVSIRQLEILLGKYPSAQMQVGETIPLHLEEIPAGIPADILTRRPDIISAERRLAAADCNVWAAKAALFPSISLTGSYGTSSNDLSKILDPDFTIWSLASNILQPIFQGGRLAANVSINKAMQKQAFSSYANTVLTAYSEIESILANEQYYLKQANALKVAADEAQASLNLAEDRYYKGLIGIITLLDSRRSANNALSQLLTVQRQRVSNRVDFYVALGGGY